METVQHTCIADRIWNYVQAGLSNYTDIILKEKIEPRAVDYIPERVTYVRMHIKREFKPETWAMAERITKNLRGSLLINGKNPKSIAAGIIYTSSIICGDNVTQQELSRNMGVTTETIRKSYKLIKIDMKL